MSRIQVVTVATRALRVVFCTEKPVSKRVAYEAQHAVVCVNSQS